LFSSADDENRPWSKNLLPDSLIPVAFCKEFSRITLDIAKAPRGEWLDLMHYCRHAYPRPRNSRLKPWDGLKIGILHYQDFK